ncbi:Fur family transcriptional regulator [Streptomyces sp. NPDC001634]|uniref:Fur family transcriptional regulator n=1 Tax=Streptomyces sp. NPDC001634 TaxID=3154390 RepID=UPI003322054F
MVRNRSMPTGAGHPDARHAPTVDGDRAAQEPMARAATRLRDAQLRVTAQRMAVLAAVEELPGHPEVEAIRARAQQVTGRLSLQATYNVLRVLTEAGMIRCTQIAGLSARYEPERNDNHHHFVCRLCGDIIDVECVVGAAPCLEGNLPASYRVDEAAVTFWGACERCAAQRR